jgi:dTDP-4-amino-4,6-dideoxygalactose transaminase
MGEKLALFGGPPVRERFLPFHQPLIGAEERRELGEALDSGWLTTGPRAKRFEEAFRAYIGCGHALGVSSCTAALHLALLALGIGEGDEVITSPVTFPATANVIIHVGARPVFVDVEPDTLNLDTAQIADRITPRTRAILPVHFAGHPSEMDEVLGLAERHALAVVEDAAHAIESAYRGRKVGAIGTAAAFSFYPTKNLTTGEGGMLTTSDPALAERARILSLHGLSKDAWRRYGPGPFQHWEALLPGYKYNLSDLQAALGLHQLPRVEAWLEVRRRYAEMYTEAFAGLPGIQPLGIRPHVRHAHHLYVILVRPECLAADRDQILLALQQEGIGVGVHFRSLHLHPYYRDRFGFQPDDFPVARWASDRVISLPLYPKMTQRDVAQVIEAVRKVHGAFAIRPQ